MNEDYVRGVRDAWEKVKNNVDPEGKIDMKSTMGVLGELIAPEPLEP